MPCALALRHFSKGEVPCARGQGALLLKLMSRLDPAIHWQTQVCTFDIMKLRTFEQLEASAWWYTVRRLYWTRKFHGRDDKATSNTACTSTACSCSLQGNIPEDCRVLAQVFTNSAKFAFWTAVTGLSKRWHSPPQ